MRVLIELTAWSEAPRAAQAEVLRELAEALRRWNEATAPHDRGADVRYSDTARPIGTPDVWRDARAVRADAPIRGASCVELAAMYARRGDSVVVLPPDDGGETWHAVVVREDHTVMDPVERG